jgi:hypothetical protein
VSGRYQVRCSDGAVRHRGVFATRAEAARWAEWGHLCTATHTIVDVAPDPQVRRAEA